MEDLYNTIHRTSTFINKHKSNHDIINDYLDSLDIYDKFKSILKNDYYSL